MQLSKNFTLAEMCHSPTAIRLGINNKIPPESSESSIHDQNIIRALKTVCKEILQPVRDHYGIPFRPSSGYRCLALNRALKSKDSSQHVLGQAVDFEVPTITNIDLALWIDSNLKFDQLILEHYVPGDDKSGWVHCSIIGGNRQNVMTYSNGTFKKGLVG